MITFDITQHPPTRQELEADKQELSTEKKQQIRRSVVSDSVHGAALFGLYWADQLSGYGLQAVIGLGTVLAVIMATTLKKRLHKSDIFTVVFISVAAACAVGGTVHGLPRVTVTGSVSAGLITGSIILFSTLIGRNLLLAYHRIEQLKNLTEYEDAEEEMLQLCRENPQLEDYRQLALQILRPNLTLGELQAMRDWTKQ